MMIMMPWNLSLFLYQGQFFGEVAASRHGNPVNDN